ncbi:MAG: gamma carbonic anhydrase family protein [Oscillospiraceae bacterium]|nr:gamma carbonic anhydrase family protein [Oscillospiraceae bacterium]
MDSPVIHSSAFVAKNATVLGRVTLCENISVYFGAVIRAEMADIKVGQMSNIQDNCVLHADAAYPLSVGEGVTVGHGAILHGCTVGDNCLIGMGSIILNGAVIGKNCIVGAGSLVTQRTVIPEGSMVMGSPATVVLPLRPEEIEANRRSANFYCREAEEYKGF